MPKTALGHNGEKIFQKCQLGTKWMPNLGFRCF
jgi:hypothetical protein